MKLIFQLRSVSDHLDRSRSESVHGLLMGSLELILEQTEPGDDIDEDLVTIRIQEPEVSSKDLGKF